MSDVNFLKYAQNFQRLEGTAESGSTFLADNGYYIGVLLAFLAIVLGVIFIFLIVVRMVKKNGGKLFN